MSLLTQTVASWRHPVRIRGQNGTPPGYGGPVSMREEVKAALTAFAAEAPGRSVEIPVPPYGAIQAVPGGAHRRGTPRAVVECDGPTWLALVRGELTWAEAFATGRIEASGERSDLSEWLPLQRMKENDL